MMSAKKILVLLVALLIQTAACNSTEDASEGANESADDSKHLITTPMQNDFEQRRELLSIYSESNRSSEGLLEGPIYDASFAVYLIKTVIAGMPTQLTTQLSNSVNKEISKILMSLNIFGEVSEEEVNELKLVLTSRYELKESYIIFSMMGSTPSTFEQLELTTVRDLCTYRAVQNYFTLLYSESDGETYEATLRLVFCAEQSQCAFCNGFHELFLR